MSDLTDGVHPHVTPREYHAWEFHQQLGPISNSILKDYADRGPAAFRYGEAKPSTTALNWGSLVDCILFTPDLLADEFIEKERNPFLSQDGGARSAKARDWIKEQDRVVVPLDTIKEATRAVGKLQNTPASAEILEGAATQVALVHTGAAGIPVKVLPDIIPAHDDHDDCLADLKTTSVNVHDDDALARQVGTLKYHWQAALYLYVFNKLHPGNKRHRWKIIWQSSSPPYEVRVTELDELWIEQGQNQVQAYISRMISDMKSGAWLSPFRKGETILNMHNPTQYAEERRLEVLDSLNQ
jgi:hypothetical protein